MIRIMFFGDFSKRRLKSNMFFQEEKEPIDILIGDIRACRNRLRMSDKDIMESLSETYPPELIAIAFKACDILNKEWVE